MWATRRTAATAGGWNFVICLPIARSGGLRMGRPVFGCWVEDDGRASHDAHTSESMYGAPGVIVREWLVQGDCMKWYHYLACFFAGAFLIHVIPHVMHGMSAVNVAGVIVSLGGGCLLLWLGRFSLKNGWAILLVVMGMVSVLLFFYALHAHHG